MPPPPPKKKTAPPLPARKPHPFQGKEPRQNGVRFQVNMSFENEEHMRDYLQSNIPNAKVISTWKVTLIRCQVEVPQIKQKPL